MPLFHTWGMGACIFGAAVSGATLVILEDPHPFLLKRHRALELIEAERITVFPGVPFNYRLMADSPAAADLSSLRLCFTAGMAMPRETFEAFGERFGVLVRQLYGNTASVLTPLGSAYCTPTATGSGSSDGTTSSMASSARTSRSRAWVTTRSASATATGSATAVFEVTQPRVTCYRVGIRMEDPRIRHCPSPTAGRASISACSKRAWSKPGTRSSSSRTVRRR